MEQAGCAGGDAPSGLGANAKEHLLVRRLRGAPRQLATRAASGPALGALRPLCEVLADGPGDTGTRKRGPELGESRKAFARAAAERREARRPASWAGDLRRSEDRSARETDQRVRRSAPAPVGALLPSCFSRSGKQTKAQPARHDKRAAERWLKGSVQDAERARRSAELDTGSITLPWRGRVGEHQGASRGGVKRSLRDSPPPDRASRSRPPPSRGR
jgi:hypothetical protein